MDGFTENEEAKELQYSNELQLLVKRFLVISLVITIILALCAYFLFGSAYFGWVMFTAAAFAGVTCILYVVNEMVGTTKKEEYAATGQHENRPVSEFRVVGFGIGGQNQVAMTRQMSGQKHFLASGKIGWSLLWPVVLVISQASIRWVLQP